MKEKSEVNMKKLSVNVAMFLMCLLFGFLASMQFKTVKVEGGNVSNTASLRAADLQSRLNQEIEKNSALSAQLLEYKDELSLYRENALLAGDASDLLNQQLRRAELLSGLTDVHGPGVIVTMRDSEMDNDSEHGVIDENYFLIHDEDLLRVLNELRDAGAEAMSLNGERILATTEIRCAGATVSVNNNRYSVPYVIQAIGDPENLRAALTMRGGVVDSLANWGIVLTIDNREDITIDAYGGAIQYKYAEPVQPSQ